MQDKDGATSEVCKREKKKLKDMQRLKKQKIQEILDAQNAAIDADMVCHLNELLVWSSFKLIAIRPFLFVSFYTDFSL